MSDEQILLTSLSDGVFSITLNRPKVNAFNFALIEALQKALRQAERDPAVRVVTLCGAGDNFSAGQDVTEFLKGEELSYRYHLQRTYNPLIVQMRRLEKPIIGVLNGAVSGAALGLALACDLRIASERVRIVVGFGGIGLAPDSAVSLLLPALIGLGRASEFTFSNLPISAEQALAWGLVNRVVPTAELLTHAAIVAAMLARGPVNAMGLAKRAFNKAVLPNLEEVLDYEGHLQEIAGHCPEHKEGVAAFLEKRLPNFSA
ncbi:MAG: enoyl-CoA hydratase/isomerase family protein [Chloroflexota bacterium]